MRASIGPATAGSARAARAVLGVLGVPGALGTITVLASRHVLDVLGAPAWPLEILPAARLGNPETLKASHWGSPSASRNFSSPRPHRL